MYKLTVYLILATLTLLVRRKSTLNTDHKTDFHCILFIQALMLALWEFHLTLAPPIVLAPDLDRGRLDVNLL